MPEQKLNQLLQEVDAWKRLLGFMVDENVYLKNRLSAILCNEFDSKHLDAIEAFQERFVKQDQLISLLRNEVAELDKLLVTKIIENGQLMVVVAQKLVKVRRNICNAEKKSGELKTAFNRYILDTMYSTDY